MKVTVGTVTDRGLNPKRAHNEDRFLVIEERGLFLVADGVGGRRGGQVASQAVVDVFKETFAKRPGLGVAVALEAAIIESNRRIFETSIANADLEGMATTLAVLALDGTQAVLGHVGDSRIYQLSDGSLTRETEDHSEVNEAVRAGVISAAMAAHDPLRNVLTRAIGVDPDVEPDVKTIRIEPGSRFLLCSDGITRHIPDATLEGLLDGSHHPQQVCEILRDHCFERGAEDNLTAVVVDFGERTYIQSDVPKPPVFVSPARRIEVDVRSQDESRPSSETASVPAEVPAPRSSRGGSHVVRNGLILMAVIVIGIAIGRYYDTIRSWVDQSLARVEGTPSPTPGPVPAALDPELAAARVLFEEQRFEKARDQLNELVRRSPDRADYHYWLGLTSIELKEYEGAIRELNEAVRLDDRLPGVHGHLARAYKAVGDRRKMEESLRREKGQ